MKRIDLEPFEHRELGSKKQPIFKWPGTANIIGIGVMIVVIMLGRLVWSIRDNDLLFWSIIGGSALFILLLVALLSRMSE